MDYVFDIPVPYAPRSADDPASTAIEQAVRNAGRQALQQALGGTPAQVLLAWLECEENGGAPPLGHAHPEMTLPQLRWHDACVLAIEASLLARGFNPRALDPEDYSHMMDWAWVMVLPVAPGCYRHKEDWQQAFLARLHQFELCTTEVNSREVVEQEYPSLGECHPVCAADYYVAGNRPSSLGPAMAPWQEVDHPIYGELRDELERQCPSAYRRASSPIRKTLEGREAAQMSLLLQSAAAPANGCSLS